MQKDSKSGKGRVSKSVVAKKVSKRSWPKEFKQVQAFVKKTESNGASLSDNVWANKLQQVQEFVKKTGSLPRCHSSNADERRLGSWCSRQKSQSRRGVVVKSQKKQLESINGWYWSVPVSKKSNVAVWNWGK